MELVPEKASNMLHRKWAWKQRTSAKRMSKLIKTQVDLKDFLTTHISRSKTN